MLGETSFYLVLSRKFDWGKKLSWYIQNKFHVDKNVGKITSRNNTMRPLVEFLEYDDRTRLIYYKSILFRLRIFRSFVDELKVIVETENLNLLNATVRYTKAHEEGFLNYANEDTFAFVLLFNHRLAEKGIVHMEQATREIVDAALALEGTYYLTYQLFPSQQQIQNRVSRHR